MKPFIAAVDWGTSSFRIWLLDSAGHILAEDRSDEGMMKAREIGFPTVLDRHLTRLSADPELPVMICGMAGAKQGWQEAPYVETPASLDDLVGRSVRVSADYPIHILPGVCQRSFDAPDVMRGEETQLLGAFSKGGASGIVCLPGTHTKWVLMEKGIIRRFTTFMTGEIYAAIAGHTILKLALAEGEDVDPEGVAFTNAVLRAVEKPALATSRIFAIRSAPLLNIAGTEDAAAKLSGELIGLEIAGALEQFGELSKVELIGSGKLATLYRAALEAAGLSVHLTDADQAVRAGLLTAGRGHNS